MARKPAPLPAVIPEIAQAYQNDPRTKLAQAAIESGTATSPVAGGDWAYADGLARVAQALAGAYSDKKTQARYAQEEADLIAQRQKRAENAMAAMSPPSATPVAATPPQPPPGPAAGPAGVAAALGTPPPQAQARAPASIPGLPMAPVPGPVNVPITPFTTQGTAEAAQGAQAPFVSKSETPSPSSSSASSLVMPEAPAPLARPTRPEAVSATQSPLLRAAYDMMLGGNRYESAQAQDMYQRGLTEQGRFDEARAAREQNLIDQEYGTDLGMFSSDTLAGREDTRQTRRDVASRQFSRDERIASQDFSAGEAAKDRAFRAGEAAKDRAATRANAIIAAAQRVSKGANLPDKVAADLTDMSQKVDALGSLNAGFEPRYVGKAPGIGSAQVWAARRAGTDVPQSAWWEEYQAFVNEVRHGQFGAALSKQEKREFEKQMVVPSSSPEVARRNLARQQRIAQEALSRRVAQTTLRYDSEQINAAIGRDPSMIITAPMAATAAPKGGNTPGKGFGTLQER